MFLSRSEHRHCPASRGMRGGKDIGWGAERWSLDSFHSPSPPSSSSPAKRWKPCNYPIQEKRCLCIYFLSHCRPFVNVIALVWDHTFQLQKIVSFWNIFILTPHVLSVWRQEAVERKTPTTFNPSIVVTYLSNCSINDTALIFYMPSPLIYLLSGCLLN